MLPQPAALGIFVAENRRIQVVHFAGQGLGVKVVFQEAANRAGGSFRLQGHRALALVFKSIHFLLDDVRGISHAPEEKLRMFKHRGAYFSVAGQGGGFTHSAFDIVPAVTVCGQYVPGSAGCLCQHVLPPVSAIHDVKNA